MARVDVFRKLEEGTATTVVVALAQALAELRCLLTLAQEPSVGAVAPELEAAVQAVIDTALDEVARPLFEAHPQLVPPALALALAPVTTTVEEEISTDENEVPS